MKSIPVDELAAIHPAIHAEAVQIGCEHVRVSGWIWPGGRPSGPAGEEIRLIEYSWKKAAVVQGEAVYESDDPKKFAALLNRYGLGDEESYPEPEEPVSAIAPERAALTVLLLPATKAEIERRAAEAQLTAGEWLDRHFGTESGG